MELRLCVDGVSIVCRLCVDCVAWTWWVARFAQSALCDAKLSAAVEGLTLCPLNQRDDGCKGSVRTCLHQPTTGIAAFR